MTKPSWVLPTALILLTAIPVGAGGDRIGQLTSGAAITAANARFFADPIPVVIHIIGASTFCWLGAVQFSPSFRARHPRWHRVAGRILVPCGIAAALSGMYMAVFYPEPADVGPLLTTFRLFFGTAMATCLGLGLRSALRRDFAAHRAWMMRGYAIGIGAGTQAFTQLAWIVPFGPVDRLSNALTLLTGWLINLAVAEWFIRRPALRRNRYRAVRA